MKKSKVICLIFLVVVLTLTVLAAAGFLCGCENKSAADPAEPSGEPGPQTQLPQTQLPLTQLPQAQLPQQQSGQEGSVVIVDYEVISYEAMPDNVKALVDGHKKEAVVTIVAFNNSKYVFIALGARSTGGYSVVIKSVTECQGLVTVVYSEQKPEKSAMVTQAFTYPWIVIKIDTGLPIDVISE